MAATVQLYKCGFCTNIFVDLASARTHKCTGKGVQPKLQNASVPPSQTQTQKGGKSSVPKPQAGDHSVTMPLNAPVPPSQTQKQGNSSVTKPQNVSFPPLESRTQQAGKSSVTVPLNASVPQSQMQQADTRGENVVWQRVETLLLIDQYKSFEGKIKKKRNISEQCEGRWKTLVRGVKKVADHNSKSGNDLKTHPYEDELEFYSERPNVKPAYLVSSSGSLVDLESIEEDSEEDITRSTSPVPAPAPAPAPVKKRRSNVSEVLDVLKVHIQSQSDRHQETLQRQEQMHQERMTVMKGFLDVFKDMKN
ncbi:Hypothetical predicted protein [Paramuricea clavata]|uniref:Uncharacterized protein n=1 Tax=Paramuricea clavata TaxID=317549 RepID=A0A6S7I208_PARCT|nr:Hypothetical predicted protein [Paramuricea clavata]